MSMSNQPSPTTELGTLIVVVLKARNLIDKHKLYKQDAYAQTSLNGTMQKTQVDVKGGQHPVWDAELRFPVLKATSDTTRKLEISCFSKEPRSDDLLGKGVVDITETLKTGEFDDWVSLSINGVVRGEVYLEMTYFASGPAPKPAAVKPNSSNLAVPTTGYSQYLQRRPSKLPPSERLSRPPQVSSSATPNPASSGSGTVPAPTSGPSSSQPPSSLRPSSRPASQPLFKGKAADLPPLPEENPPVPPSNLHVGGVTRPKPQAPGSSSLSPALPALLRPGGGNMQGYGYVPEFRAQSDREQRLSPSPSPPSSKVKLSPPQQASPNPYTGTPSYTRVPAEPPSPAFYRDEPDTLGLFTGGASMSTNHHPAYTDSAAWNDYGLPNPPVTFSFPVPAPPAPLSLPQTHLDSYQSYGPQQADFTSSSTPRSNPYTPERYLNPLPLPPKVPITESDAGARNPSHNDKGPGQGAEEQISQSLIDSNRLEALRRAEKEAAQRKEQEKKDLELALQLDRELNMVGVK